MGDRDLDSLADFALGGYKEESDSSLKVPGDLTNIERLQRMAKKFYDELIFQFNYVFNMFGYAHLPAPAKVIIVLIFLFSPAVVLALLVCIWEMRYIKSKQVEPLDVDEMRRNFANKDKEPTNDKDATEDKDGKDKLKVE